MNGELRYVIIVLSVLAIAATCSLSEAEQYISAGTDYVFEPRQAVDYAMLIDRSGSMRVGGRFSEVQSASSAFVDQLVDNDRAAIIGFDSSASLYTSFTSDKDRLHGVIARMSIGDWTQYQAGLSSALEQFRSRETINEEVLILMSDGRPDDREDELFAAVDEVVNEGVCVYTIAYADAADEVAQRYLRQIANTSQQVNGCGQYFRAQEGSFDLRRIYTQIFDLASSQEVFDVSVDVETEPTLTLSADITSSVNGRQILGAACFAPEIQFLITDGQRVVFSQESLNSSAQLLLGQGEYEYFVTARESCGGECSFTGRTQGTFNITQGSVACQATYDQVSAIVRDEESTTVRITAQGLVPREVSAGSLVTWTNEDSVDHVIVGSGSSAFESPRIPPGNSWQFAFRNGVHTYRLEDSGFEGRVLSSPMSSRRSASVDLSLLIDHSGSMAGEPLRLIRESSKSLLSRLSSRDRAAVISFSDSASIRSALTSDISALSNGIDSISAGSSTQYSEALLRLPEVMAGSRADARTAIFLSDGIPSDVGGVDSVIDSLSRVLGDVCLYTVGYGEQGVLAVGALHQMTSFSQHSNDCGLFYYASASQQELSAILGEIFSLSLPHDLDVYDVSLERSSRNRYEVSARVKSSHNDVLLPSSGVSCVPPAQVFAFFDDRRFPLRHVGDDLYAATIFISEDSAQGIIVASVVNEDAPSEVLVGSAPVEYAEVSVFWWVAGFLFLLLSGFYIFGSFTGRLRP